MLQIRWSWCCAQSSDESNECAKFTNFSRRSNPNSSYDNWRSHRIHGGIPSCPYGAHWLFVQVYILNYAWLIYVFQKCVGSVLVRTCELETHLGWHYQACTKCASRVTAAAGSLYCDKCKMPRNAIPRQVHTVRCFRRTPYVVVHMLPSSFDWCFLCRFKVHVEVIDNTGSTTFILFDRVVTQFLGRTVKDLLDGMQNVWIFFF